MKSGQLMILLTMVVCGLVAPPTIRGQEPPPDSAAAETAPSCNLSLSLPQEIPAGESFSSEILVHDSEGKPVADFDLFQERLMHLFLVSGNLDSFQELSSEYLGDGRFRTDILLPEPGSYVLFSDFFPSGSKEQVAALALATATAVPSDEAPAAIDLQPDLSTEQTSGDTKATLTLVPQPPTAGQEALLSFELNHAESLRPVTELQPYLGGTGALVILRQASPLTAKDYIHSQALPAEGDGSVIRFSTRFPTPGLYRLWLQFNLGGTVQTVGFWVPVE
jgi:hypothetical protein